MSAYGPTVDNRRKPDLCGPGEAKTSTRYCWIWQNAIFAGFGGTSSATPYVAGALALMKEARSSLTPRQSHAILLNSAAPLGSQDNWEEQAGWGQLNAYHAVLWRNRTVDGTVTDPDDSETFQLSTVPAGDDVVVTLVWHRAMDSETDPAEDGDGNPSPACLELFLERKVSGGEWEHADSDVVPPNGDDDGNPEDNVRRVTAVQAEEGQSQYQFRVRVEHNPTTDTPYKGSQGFSLASRHAFATAP